MKKTVSFIFVFVLCMSFFVLGAEAKSSWVGVYINNEEFSGNVDVKDYTTFVGIRNFATSMDKNAKVSYDYSTKTVTVKTYDVTITAKEGTNYIVANGRYLYTSSPIYMENGVIYAPVISMAKAFDAKISWKDSSSSFYITKGSGGILSGNRYYDSDQVYWLSRIINAEAEDEILAGKIAVGNVILNRVRSYQFPNTTYGVIFDKKYGVQFSSTQNGRIYQSPNSESIIAAKICLEGYSINTNMLYFVNPAKSPNSWISNNRTLFAKIGNHAFYF